MIKRRWPTEARKGRASPHREVWRPVTLVEVDIEQPPEAIPLDLDPGDRIWVEVMCAGIVVGVVETRAEGGGLPARFISELAGNWSPHPGDVASVPDGSLPTATVVVPTICTDPAELTRTVSALQDLDYPDFEIIVVDNRTTEPALPLPDFRGPDTVRVARELRPGCSAARNCGTALAAGEIVAFTDDDAVADTGWLRAMGTRFALDDKVEAIGGLVLPLELQTEAQLWFEEFYGGFTKSFSYRTMSIAADAATNELFPYAPGIFGAGCNMAFRRTTLQRVGGFDPSLGVGTPARGGEDLAMFMRIALDGGTLAFEPAAVVRHSHRRTERAFQSQVFSYGAGLTAMYAALIARDPMQLAHLLGRVPAGVRLLTRPREVRSPSMSPSYPRSTLARQLCGMAYGPFAYARSVARNRRTA